jgi:HlyD family secretion protein
MPMNQKTEKPRSRYVMKLRQLAVSIAMGLLVLTVVACGAFGGSEEEEQTAVAEATQEAEAEAEDEGQTPTPTFDVSSLLEPAEDDIPDVDLSAGVSGIGEVETDRDADLVFTVQGTVQEIFVEEGAVVTDGQLLATLDVRRFDYEVDRAEASLRMAEAGRVALNEPPRAADLESANAQIRQAQASLEQIQQPPEEVNVKAAQASLDLANVQLHSTRDSLSHQKTQAELQVDQAVFQLTQAQWDYALAQRFWEHADDHDTDPLNPSTSNPMTGQSVPNDLSKGQQAQYRTRFEQAQAAMKQAEEALQQALKAAEGARKSEVTGVHSAEQQVVQAQAQLEQVLLPPNEHAVAQAQAGVDAAIANRNRLYPDPRDSQVMQAEAQIDQAQSALDLAKLNREDAELRAPFDGIISEVNIDSGDPSMSSVDAAIKIVDLENTHVTVDISDVDIATVEVGQPSMVYADALPGEIFKGEVTYIAPSADVRGNIRTYEVKIKLDNSEGLRPGMSVRVEIDTGEEEEEEN